MSDELRLTGACFLSLLTALAMTPVARRLALRFDFHDHPGGYKSHERATPYLGGLALAVAVTAGGLAFAADDRLLPLAGGALLLWLVGTVDDRRSLGPLLRVIATLGAGAALWAGDLGWSVLESEAANLALTLAWVLGVVNAFNLMDNMDGAAGTVGMVCGLGAGALAIDRGDAHLAALGFAVAGACAGFLRHNLVRPARIFLGDGGSMPLGYTLAAIAMAAAGAGDSGSAAVPIAIVALGLPVLDTSLVVVSRIRRRVAIAAGGTDHVTHRLGVLLGSPQAVALVLIASQAAFCSLALALAHMSRAEAWGVALGVAAVGAMAISLLELPWARPAFERAPTVPAATRSQPRSAPLA